MIKRPFWTDRLVAAWKQASIVWLTGPRRAGKTVLAQSLPDAEFLNCDLPSVAERLRDPESFFRSVKKKFVVLDEVHQLPDPSRLLKIGADDFPKLKILATGSSTLAATQKFRDSLTGRKRVVELVPVLHEELPAFGVADLRERLLRGGLPPALLAEKHNPEFYAEWLDSYFARDVQELFRLEKRAGFLRVLELLLRQSGGMLEVTKLAAESQISRPAVTNWLEVYQITHVAHLVRPFRRADGARSSRSRKCLDSTRGWSATRAAGIICGRRIAACYGSISCWTRSSPPACRKFISGATNSSARWTSSCRAGATRWTPSNVNGNPMLSRSRGLAAFRERYPKGKNYVVSPLNGPSYERIQGGLKISIVSPGELRQAMA